MKLLPVRQIRQGTGGWPCHMPRGSSVLGVARSRGRMAGGPHLPWGKRERAPAVRARGKAAQWAASLGDGLHALPLRGGGLGLWGGRRLGHRRRAELGMQRLQLPVVAGEHIRHVAAKHLADGGLRDAGSFGDLLLRQAAADDRRDEVSGFHVHGCIPLRLLCQSVRNMQPGLNERMPRPPTLDTLAGRLRLARKKRGLSQEDVAAHASLKQSDVSKLETGRMLKTTGIARLARTLRVPDAWLELGEGPEPAWDDAPGAPLVAQEPIAQYGQPSTALHELQLQLLQDMEDLLPEDAAKFRAEIHERAEAMRRHRDFFLKKTNAGGIAPAHKVAHIPVAPDIAPAPKPVQDGGYTGPERRHRDMPVLNDRRKGGLPEEYLGAKPSNRPKGKAK